jgi:hypothetical protein
MWADSARTAWLPGPFSKSADALTVTGSALSDPSPGTGGFSIQRALIGTVVGLIPPIVVRVMFITAEYRHGLIRISLIASPHRSRLLAAKAIMLSAVS